MSAQSYLKRGSDEIHLVQVYVLHVGVHSTLYSHRLLVVGKGIDHYLSLQSLTLWCNGALYLVHVGMHLAGYSQVAEPIFIQVRHSELAQVSAVHIHVRYVSVHIICHGLVVHSAMRVDSASVADCYIGSIHHIRPADCSINVSVSPQIPVCLYLCLCMCPELRCVEIHRVGEVERSDINRCKGGDVGL